MKIRMGKTERRIHELLDERGALLFTVIDPVDYSTPDAAIKTAAAAERGGSDVILVGGSVGAQGELLEYVTKGIHEYSEIPLILFPGNIATISRYADALYFMSLLNARNPYWITQAQMLSAPLIKRLGIEPLPVGYIVIYPGGTVGWVGDANLVPREKPHIASSLALAGEYLGNRFIITDVGSNPQLQGYTSVPLPIIKSVSEAVSVPYIVGGGIRDAASVRSIIKGGADIIQVGTALEKTKAAEAKTRLFSRIIREEGKKKLR